MKVLKWIYDHSEGIFGISCGLILLSVGLAAAVHVWQLVLR